MSDDEDKDGQDIVLALSGVTKNANGTLNVPSRPVGIAIYDRSVNPIIDLTRRAVENT